MAEKLKGKPLYIIIAVVAAIVVLIISFAIVKKVQNNSWKKATSAEAIVISDKDSNEVKAEKLQKKIELINADIEKIQVKLNPELEKLNSLYEEYVNVMNENQTVAPAVEEQPAEETPAEETTEETVEE